MPPRVAPAEADGAATVEHVHGLGVDPADGFLYAATHYGVFRVPERGAAARVANRFQDTMGFTIGADSRFYGSGHPDLRLEPDLPVRLGLIISEDRAETWQPASLAGEADFHALEVRDEVVIGWDSTTGSLLASSDGGVSWQERSSLVVQDIAVHPLDTERIAVTTNTGLELSSDGGRSFQLLDAPAGASLVSWSSADRLVLATVDGDVHHSRDDGATWESTGNMGGRPQALLDVGGALYAARPGAVVQSDDGGRTWRTRVVTSG